MQLLILPSLLAISLKIAIFMRYHDSLSRENLNLGIFFFAALLLNIVEMIALDQHYTQQTDLLLLITYYCCAVFIIHAYLNIAIQYSEFSWRVGRFKTGLNIVLALLVCNLIFNRTLIADVQVVDFSLTKVAGPNSWAFQLYAICGLLFAIGLLIHGVRHVGSNIGKQQCLTVLLSTAMPVLVTFAIIGLQAIGVQITSTLFMSLALTLMLAIMIYAKEKTRLFRLLTFVPFTRERRLHKQLFAQITSCIAINDNPALQQSLNLKQMMRQFEGLVVEHVLDYYEGNQKLTATALGVSEATVSRRARASALRRQTQDETQVSIAIKE
jgi:hypothetical protein